MYYYNRHKKRWVGKLIILTLVITLFLIMGRTEHNQFEEEKMLMSQMSTHEKEFFMWQTYGQLPRSGVVPVDPEVFRRLDKILQKEKERIDFWQEIKDNYWGGTKPPYEKIFPKNI